MSAKSTMTGSVFLRRRVMPAAAILLTAGLAVLAPAPQPAFAVPPGLSGISAGFEHTCAIGGGQGYCWGANESGELGDGTTGTSSVPVAVDTSGALAGKTLTQISAGLQATCALDTSGAAYCWGDNVFGGLGDGSTASSSVPVAVSPIVSGERAAKCVEDPGYSGANDTPVVIGDCDGGAGQNWTAEPGGTLQIHGKCMDIYREEKTSKAPVELWTCTGGANQQWTASNGTLVNPASGKCLDDPGFNVTDGTRLEIYTCNGGLNQQWKLP